MKDAKGHGSNKHGGDPFGKHRVEPDTALDQRAQELRDNSKHWLYRKGKSGKVMAMGHPDKASAVAAMKEAKKYQKEYSWSVGRA